MYNLCIITTHLNNNNKSNTEIIADKQDHFFCDNFEIVNNEDFVIIKLIENNNIIDTFETKTYIMV